MTRSLRLWVVAAALLAALLLAACDDDGGDEGDGDDEQPTVADKMGDEDAGDQADGTDGDGDDVGSELQSLAERWGDRSAKVTYEFSSTFSGEAQEGSLTLYWRPPDAWRADFSMDGSEGTFIVSGAAAYSCSADGGQGQCIELPAGAEAIPIPFLGAFTDPGEFNESIAESITGVDLDRSQRDIAGQEAECFSVAGTVEGESGSSEWCFSGDGILLLLSSEFSGPEGSGSFALEATSVEGEVSDADLEPPYDVFEVPQAP